MKATDLPETKSIFQCNLTTTYFMEMWKGDNMGQVKFYESNLWVNEFDQEFSITLTDAELCNCDQKLPIWIKFISRNQYKMTNQCTTMHKTTLSDMIQNVG